MSLKLACVGILAISSSTALLTAQVAPIQTPQLIRQSLGAQAGSAPLQDVVLNGTVERIVGSDVETAPFLFKATANGLQHSEISLSSGTLSESRRPTKSGIAGTWSRGDGLSHAMSGHNLLSSGDWCFPAFIMDRLLSEQDLTVSYLGNDAGLVHIHAFQSSPSTLSKQLAEQARHFSQIDLYLSPDTLLPARLSFNEHPDNNVLIDIPVSVEFSDYQTIDGRVVPMQIRKYIRDVLQLRVQVQSVTFNNGLTFADFESH